MINQLQNKTGKVQYARQGIILLITLVLLVVLSTLGYILSTRVSAQRHRDQYIIDYQSARYGCDSAVKYALATLQELDPQLVSRPNDPDFSDLFALTEEQYRELLARFAAESAQPNLDQGNDYQQSGNFNELIDNNDVNDLVGGKDPNDLKDVNDFSPDETGMGGFMEANSVTIKGPYGPPWPLVTEPAEFEIGSAKVKIEIEDENAKYPLGWVLLADKEVQPEAEASFKTFCEWMGAEEVQMEIEALKARLEDLKQNEAIAVKKFQIEFTPLTRVERQPIPPPASTRSTSRSRVRRVPRTRLTRKTVSVSQQIAEQGARFSRLFHSSMLDTEVLARPTIISETRKESPLKYLGMWGSRKVNINTAPRHVLEAAFVFGGNAKEIAEGIIQRRRIKPFSSLEELRQTLFTYSNSIEKCSRYITTNSSFFTIRVTAVSGVAKATSVIAITKNGKKIERIAIISG